MREVGSWGFGTFEDVDGVESEVRGFFVLATTFKVETNFFYFNDDVHLRNFVGCEREVGAELEVRDSFRWQGSTLLQLENGVLDGARSRGSGIVAGAVLAFDCASHSLPTSRSSFPSLSPL